MGPEVNIDSILALEKQIEEGLGDVIQLKRARNSLLNIFARLPPELLGKVFHWNTIPVGDCGEVRRGSYNFLLVCHRWFEVASGTPELWTYWGNTLKLWSQRYQRSGIAPLDLVLLTHKHIGGENVFDGPLRDALRARAADGSIRSVQFRGWDTDQLNSVISSLTPDGDDIRDSSIESLTLEYTDLDITTFLAHHRFPRLRVLRLLTHARISSWDHLILQAAPQPLYHSNSRNRMDQPHPNCFRFSPLTRTFKTSSCTTARFPIMTAATPRFERHCVG